MHAFVNADGGKKVFFEIDALRGFCMAIEEVWLGGDTIRRLRWFKPAELEELVWLC